jgi:hypothetical protein
VSKIKLSLHRLLHWEYWPFGLVYLPIYFVWVYYAIKAKSFFFFNAANPTIRNGGFLMESKKEIYDLIPNQHIPKTLFFKQGSQADEILSQTEKAGINFPFIAKPDIGMRGLAVDRIQNKKHLLDYLSRVKLDLIIQELIELPNEAGIFYIRLPDQPKGFISGVVGKEFMIVKGDGTSTLEDLVTSNPRFHLQLKKLKKIYGNQLSNTLPDGEYFNLVPFGSHSRGSKFLDFSHRITPRFEAIIENICQQTQGFCFGRMDVKYNTWKELEQGINFSIIEINGAGSEPTHIYDPKHNIFFAWREITKHIRLLSQISIQNHKKGHPYLSFRQGLEMLKANSAVEKILKSY